MHPFRVSLSALLFALPVVANAGGAFLFKGGTVRLADSSQQLDFGARNLDERSRSTYAVNIEARKRNGVAFGAEYLTYRHDFTPPATPQEGEARTRALMFVAKKYFFDRGPVHPYFGAGIGAGRTSVSFVSATKSFSDDEFTTVLQAVLGIELRFDNLSFVFEGKHLYHDIEGGGNEFDPTATGLFAGFGFNW